MSISEYDGITARVGVRHCHVLLFIFRFKEPALRGKGDDHISTSTESGRARLLTDVSQVAMWERAR